LGYINTHIPHPTSGFINTYPKVQIGLHMQNQNLTFMYKQTHSLPLINIHSNLNAKLGLHTCTNATTNVDLYTQKPRA